MCAILAVAGALGAVIGLWWSGRPRWWMSATVGATEFLAAISVLVALLFRSATRAPPAA